MNPNKTEKLFKEVEATLDQLYRVLQKVSTVSGDINDQNNVRGVLQTVQSLRLWASDHRTTLKKQRHLSAEQIVADELRNYEARSHRYQDVGFDDWQAEDMEEW